MSDSYCPMLALQHIRLLCEISGVRQIMQPYEGRYCADIHGRTIYTPPATTEEGYAVCLHEYGHIVDLAFRGRGGAHILRREWRAWEIARDYAMFWTPAMDARRVRALTSYTTCYEVIRDAWHGCGPSHPVWAATGQECPPSVTHSFTIHYWR
jgi:hypothetical protein